MSTFASDYPDAGLQNLPIGGMEYFAPADNGDLYILAMPISKVNIPPQLHDRHFTKSRFTTANIECIAF
jgi:hypothetical protein